MPEVRLAVAAGRALEQFRGRRDAPPEGCMGKRIERILEIEPGRIRSRPERAQRGVVHLIELIVGQNTKPRSESPVDSHFSFSHCTKNMADIAG